MCSQLYFSFWGDARESFKRASHTELLAQGLKILILMVQFCTEPTDKRKRFMEMSNFILCLNSFQ